MLSNEKNLRTPITYQPAEGVLRTDFDRENHRAQMFIMFYAFGDGNWWTDFLTHALSGWMLTEEFETMSRSERLRHCDAIKHLTAYLRMANGCDGAKGKPSESSRMRVASAILGKSLMELFTTKQY